MPNSTVPKDVDEKKSLIRRVQKARRRWETQLKKEAMRVVTHDTGGKENPSKIFYFVSSHNKWIKKLAKELRAMKERIVTAGYVGRSKPRRMWLPTMLGFPSAIEIVRRDATSPKLATKRTRKKAIKTKTGLRRVIYETGHSYKVYATTKNGKPRRALTDWVICVCEEEDRIPSITNKWQT